MNTTEINYWSDFYKNNKVPREPSDFCKFIFNHNLFINKNIRILDCGCGNGRDTYYFSEKYNIIGIDSSSKPIDKENCKFIVSDFCNYDKTNFDLIYSRFTFHSISDEQQILFLKSIPINTYLCIETRSDKTSSIVKVHGDEHYRNYTNYNNLKKMITNLGFKIIFSDEDTGFAKYKDEDPCCIRIICKR